MQTYRWTTPSRTPLCGTAPGRWLIHEHSMPERLPHRKPGTAGGQYRMRLLCAVAAAPILARSGRQCTRVTATLAYGAQASMIELGNSGQLDLCGDCTTERSVLLSTIQKLSTCRSGPVTAVAACHGTWTQGVQHVDILGFGPSPVYSLSLIHISEPTRPY